MKSLNYSNLTAVLRRIHRASIRSRQNGVPVEEVLQQDQELRQKLHKKQIEDRQRRDFVKAMGGIGIGAMLPVGNMAMAAASHAQGDTKVAIIGAGAGGMRAAHRLAQYGWTSKVYEANTRIGGRMFSNTGFFSDNRTIEWGGELISTEHTALRNLVHQLNLQLEDVNKLAVGDEETYLIDGQLYSEANLLDEWVGGIYEIMKRAQQDAPWQPLYSSHNPTHVIYDQMNAISWLESLGYSSTHWVHKLLLSDLVAEYGLLEENSALNLIYLLAWNTHNSGGLPLAGTDERLHVVGGNDQVVHRMAAELPLDTIETGRKLLAIQGEYTGPYTLVFDTGPDETCDKLVMAMPYGLIKDIDIDIRITNGFSPQKIQSIAEVLTADNGKVQMEFTERHWDMVQNIGGVDVHQAARAYSGPNGFISTWEGEPGNPSSLGVLVNYNGGVQGKTLSGPNLFGVANPIDVDRVLVEIEQIWPGIGAKYNGNALVSNWWQNPYSRGAFTSPGVNTMTTWWGSQWETEGNIHFAGEACDPEVWSYMDGAIRSGERVAQEIARNA